MQSDLILKNNYIFSTDLISLVWAYDLKNGIIFEKSLVLSKNSLFSTNNFSSLISFKNIYIFSGELQLAFIKFTSNIYISENNFADFFMGFDSDPGSLIFKVFSISFQLNDYEKEITGVMFQGKIAIERNTATGTKRSM